MALTIEAQEQRQNADLMRKEAAYHRARMDQAEAAALDHDNQAIDMEDAILKLQGEDL